MDKNKSNHISSYLKGGKNGWGFQFIFYVPINLFNELGKPTHICIKHNPLRFLLPTFESNKKYKVNNHKNNDSFHSIIYTPKRGDDFDYAGKFSYEIEDCTVYLNKI